MVYAQHAMALDMLTAVHVMEKADTRNETVIRLAIHARHAWEPGL